MPADQAIDGRVARRQRNIDNVLDVVLELFAEESLLPTMEQAAQRSGLSLRSIYRYFADPAELLEAAMGRSRELGENVAHIHAIGEGTLDNRIEQFVETRLRVFEAAGPTFRATVANAPRMPRIREALARTRDDLRRQFELQFAPELDARKSDDRTRLIAAGDVLTQLDSIDYLRRHRQFSVAETTEILRTSLRSILGDGEP